MELTVETRRTWTLALLGVALAALVAAVVVTVLAVADAGTWLLIAVVVLVAALGGELYLLVAGGQKKFDEEGDWYSWEKEGGGEELLLRCSACQETFNIHDNGERPLRHTCPHCGRAGVLKDPPTAATKAV